MSDYFSDRENGPRARTHQVILPVVWLGGDSAGVGEQRSFWPAISGAMPGWPSGLRLRLGCTCRIRNCRDAWLDLAVRNDAR